MKIVLILAVAVLAVSANISPSAESLDSIKHYNVKNSEGRNGLIEGLTKIIKEIIEKTQQTIDDILVKLEGILQNVTDSIKKAIDEAQNIIHEITTKALEVLDEIAKQDEISRKCVEQNRPDIDLAISEHSLEIQACQDKATEESQNIKNDIEPHFEAIRDDINALEGIVSECLEESNGNILGAVQCIANKTGEINTELVKLVGNVKDALVTGPIRVNEIIREAHGCIQSSNFKFEQIISGIITNVNQCIEDNQ